jgi:hypothetical protein
MENKLPSKNDSKNTPMKMVFKIVALIICNGLNSRPYLNIYFYLPYELITRIVRQKRFLWFLFFSS